MGGWNDFKKLLRKKALKLVLDRKNYTNSAKCQICNKIVVMNFFTSFRLYKTKERTQFISFHSKCVFKETRFLFKEKKSKKFSDKLNEILNSFDFIVEFRKKNFLKRFFIKIRKKRTNISRKGGF